MKAAEGRQGFAVATAVFALVVVGALAIGTLFAATHELRGGSDAIHQARALMAAELGLESTIAAWQREWNGALARGYGRSWTQSTAEGAGLTVTVARLADELFLITSEARAGPARRQVGKIVRLDVGDPTALAALLTTGPLDVSESGGVDGADRSPALWDCPAPGPAVPATAALDTSAVLRFGHFDWGALVQAANSRVGGWVIGVAPRAGGEECDTAQPLNWGEPHKASGSACNAYYPVIHAPSDLVVDGGRGQGLMVVDGNLTVRGGFEFFGAVLVRGALLGGPGGARVTGSVAIAGEGATASTLEGITIDFSRCAARKALLGLATPVPIIERAWSERFDVQ